jgi:hypothetical protein
MSVNSPEMPKEVKKAIPPERNTRVWLYKDGQNPVLIEKAQAEDFKAQGWRSSFRQPGEGETPLELPKDTPVELEEPPTDEEIDAKLVMANLMAAAASINLKVDKRWGPDRLRQEIERA